MYIIKIHNWQPNIALTHGITACCSVIVTKLITSTTVVTQYWSPSQLVVVSNFAEYRWKSEQLCDYWLGKLSASTKSAWIFMYLWTRSKKVIICESLLWLFLYYYFIVVFTSWLYICDVTTTTTTFSSLFVVHCCLSNDAQNIRELHAKKQQQQQQQQVSQTDDVCEQKRIHS